jgi:hypothetical protein
VLHAAGRLGRGRRQGDDIVVVLVLVGMMMVLMESMVMVMAMLDKVALHALLGCV